MDILLDNPPAKRIGGLERTAVRIAYGFWREHYQKIASTDDLTRLAHQARESEHSRAYGRVRQWLLDAGYTPAHCVQLSKAGHEKAAAEYDALTTP